MDMPPVCKLAVVQPSPSRRVPGGLAPDERIATYSITLVELITLPDLMV
jgi:hypothetical protein